MTRLFKRHRVTRSRSYLLLVDSNPVSGGEPFVTFNVVDAVLQISEALRKVDLEKVPQHVLQVGAEVGWESNLATTHVTLILRRYCYVAAETALR